MPARGGQTAGGELVEPLGQWGGVAGVEHGGEQADQMVSAPEFGAVVEEPLQALCAVWGAGGRGR